MSDQESRLKEIRQLEEILAKRKLEYEKNYNTTLNYAGLRYIEKEYQTIGSDKNRV